MDSPAPKKRTRTRKVEQPPNEKVELTVEEPLEIPENTTGRNKYAPKSLTRQMCTMPFPLVTYIFELIL